MENKNPDAARLTASGGLFSAKKQKAVRPKEAKNTMLLTTEKRLDARFCRGIELFHLGTRSPQL
jgi:hypothetical protein